MLATSEGSWLVVRVPLAIGSSHRSRTLAQFLHDRIAREESFEVWAGATRFPIDVDDFFCIAVRYLNRLILDMWRFC
jgi:hypothetical protein